MQFVRIIIGFVVAVVIATILSSAVHTQFVLAELSALGADISLQTRLETTLYDIRHMGFGALVVVVAIGLLIAFVVAALIIRFALPNLRTFGYVLAGAAAMTAILTLMALMMGGITPIAGARSMAGSVLIVISGAVGGYAFALISKRAT